MEDSPSSESGKLVVPEFLYWLVVVILLVLLIYLVIGLYFTIRTCLFHMEHRRLRRVVGFDTIHSDLEWIGGLTVPPTQIVTQDQKSASKKLFLNKIEKMSPVESSSKVTQWALRNEMHRKNVKPGGTSLPMLQDENQNQILDENRNPWASKQVRPNNFLVYMAGADDDDDDKEAEDETAAEEDEVETEASDVQPDDEPVEEVPAESDAEPVQEKSTEKTQSLEKSPSGSNNEKQPSAPIDTDQDAFAKTTAAEISEDNEEEHIMEDELVTREPTSAEMVEEVGFAVFPVIPANSAEIQEKRTGFFSLLEYAQAEGGWLRQKFANLGENILGIPHRRPSEDPDPNFTLGPYLQPVQDFVEAIAMSAPQSATSMIIHHDENENPVPNEFCAEDFNDNDQTLIRGELDRLTREQSVGAITLLDYFQGEGSDWRYESGEDRTEKKKMAGADEDDDDKEAEDETAAEEDEVETEASDVQPDDEPVEEVPAESEAEPVQEKSTEKTQSLEKSPSGSNNEKQPSAPIDTDQDAFAKTTAAEISEDNEEEHIMENELVTREPTSAEMVEEVGFAVFPVIPANSAEIQEKRTGFFSLLEYAQAEGGWLRQKFANLGENIIGIPHRRPSEDPDPNFTLGPYLQPVQDFVEAIAMSAPQSATSMIIHHDENENPVPNDFCAEDFNDNDQTLIRGELDRLTREQSVGAITLLDYFQGEGSDWRYESGEDRTEKEKPIR